MISIIHHALLFTLEYNIQGSDMIIFHASYQETLQVTSLVSIKTTKAMQLVYRITISPLQPSCVGEY